MSGQVFNSYPSSSRIGSRSSVLSTFRNNPKVLKVLRKITVVDSRFILWRSNLGPDCGKVSHINTSKSKKQRLQRPYWETHHLAHFNFGKLGRNDVGRSAQPAQTRACDTANGLSNATITVSMIVSLVNLFRLCTV